MVPRHRGAERWRTEMLHIEGFCGSISFFLLLILTQGDTLHEFTFLRKFLRRLWKRFTLPFFHFVNVSRYTNVHSLASCTTVELNCVFFLIEAFELLRNVFLSPSILPYITIYFVEGFVGQTSSIIEWTMCSFTGSSSQSLVRIGYRGRWLRCLDVVPDGVELDITPKTLQLRPIYASIHARYVCAQPL